VNVPEAFVKGLEELVKKGLYANRSEAIRVSVRDLLKRELYDTELRIPDNPDRAINEKYIKEEQSITIH
jgi:Arc/MetJ-type ribon-helix-helix transcriptional regulator